MDFPPDPVPAVPGADEAGSADQIRSMRVLLAAMLAAMLCIGGALFIFLYRQVSMLNRQVTENTRMINEFQTNALPKINWFFGSLQTFAKTNPDFTPILAKYNLLPPPNAPAPLPAPGPASISSNKPAKK